MKKLLIIVMTILILFNVNVISAKKASASGYAIEAELKAVFTGIMGALAVVATGAVHFHEKVGENVEVLYDTAGTAWDYLSKEAKQNFAASMNAAGERIEIGTGYLNSIVDLLKIKLTDNDFSGGIVKSNHNAISISNGYKVYFVNQYNQTKEVYTGSLSINHHGAVKKNSQGLNEHYFSIYGMDSASKQFYYTANTLGSYANSVEFQNMITGFNAKQLLTFMLAHGVQLSVVDPQGNLVMGQKLGLEEPYVPPLQLDHVKDWVAQNPTVTLGVPANGWAYPTDTAGVTLGLTGNDYVYPDGRIYTGDVVYKPSPTTVTDVGGVPTVVTKTPEGDIVNTITGEAVIPSEIDTPVPNVPPNVKDEKDKLEKESRSLAKLLTTRFPFSLPWDFLALVGLLAAEPMTPKWEIDIPLDFVGNGNEAALDFEINLKFLDPYISWFRGFVMLSFVMSVIFIHSRLMGGAK